MRLGSEWGGPPHGYTKPDPSDAFLHWAQKSRFHPLKDPSMAYTVMPSGSRNSGDPRVSWGDTSHAGVNSAALDNNARKY